MDPILHLLDRWNQERSVFARSGSNDLIALSETHARELEEVLVSIAGAAVAYADASKLTGYALGSLKNMGLENIGTRSKPAFRLIDLPFKAGKATPARMLVAKRVLEAAAGLQSPRSWRQGFDSVLYPTPTKP